MIATLRPPDSTIPVQRRDRFWLNATVAAALGPFAMPSVEQIREAVTMLASKYPHSRLTWQLDARGRRWQAGRTAESIVTERMWPEGSNIGAALDAIVDDDSLEPPLSLIRFPEYLGLRMSHGIGDGRIFNTILCAVMRTAVSAEISPWPAQPAGRFPLTTAICRTFGKHPRLIKAAVCDRYPKDRETAAPRVWAPARRTITVPIAHSDFDQSGPRTKAAVHDSSRFAVHVCLILRALKAVGLEVAHDVNIVVDLRRYLGWRFVDGNFLAGVPMRIGADTTPQAASEMMRRTVATGRPLATQVLSSLRDARTNAAAVAPADACGPPRVTFSGLNMTGLDRLPFLDGRQVVAAGSVEPDGPWGVTFLNVQTPSVTWLNASFHDNGVNSTLLEQALRRVVADPEGLLTESNEVS